jgi:hypothetical protein
VKARCIPHGWGRLASHLTWARILPFSLWL